MIKNIFLTILICLFGYTLHAQNYDGYNSSIGVNLFNYAQRPQLNINQNRKTELRRYLSGVMLELYDNQISYRIGLNYYRDASFKTRQDDAADITGRYTDYSVTLGMEKELGSTALRPYIGMDAGYIHTDFTGQEFYAAGNNTLALKTEKNGLLVSPFVGIKYTFIPRLYISMEAAISFVYGYNRIEQQTAAESMTVNHYNKGEFLVCPLSQLGIHYNFGNNE